jgi:glycosyltransferase involved in cell wall biosynthesis
MRLYFAIPGDLELPTGGYGYDRQLIAELREMGWKVEHVTLPGGFPFPDAEMLAVTEAAFATIPDGAVVLVDGLAFGAMPEVAQRHRDRLKLVALVHHPLCDETGLSEADRGRLFASEKASLGTARRVICTSNTTVARLKDGFNVSGTKCVVAPPGTERVSRRAVPANEPRILAVGALVRRKGHDVLIRALAMVADRSWTARIVGPDDRDPEVTRELRGLITELGLEGRVALAGPIEDVRTELEAAQIFALASRYEGYGMAFAEALAHGLPVVACDAGAVPEVVPEDAGVLVPPDDPEAFAGALARLLDSSDEWQTAADAAWRAGQDLPDWSDTARIVAAALSEVADGV